MENQTLEQKYKSVAGDIGTTALVKAIRQNETQFDDSPTNPYEAVHDSGTGFGAYGFQNKTWDGLAQKYAGTSQISKDPKTQDMIAYLYAHDLKNQYGKAKDVLSVWNHGQPYETGNNPGIRAVKYDNSGREIYNTPAYVNKGIENFKRYYDQASSQPNYNVDYTGKNNQQPIQDVSSQREQLKSAGEPVSVNPQKAEPTFLGKAIRGIARLPMRALASLGGIEGAIADFATGRQGENSITKGIDEGNTFGSDYLGKVYPIGFGKTKEGEYFNALNSPGRSLADSAGVGAEAASYLLGGPETASLAKGLGTQGLKQLAKRGAIESAGIGATGGFGSGLQNAAGESTVGQGIKDVAVGTAEGGAGGALVGGSVPILARGGLSAADSALSKFAPESKLAQRTASAMEKVKGVAQKEKQAASDSAIDDIVLGDKKSPEFVKRKVEEGNVNSTSGTFGFNAEEQAQKKILSDMREAGTYNPDAPTDVQLKQVLEARNNSKTLEEANNLNALYEKLKEKLVKEILNGETGKKTILKTAKNYAKNKAKNYLLSKAGLGGTGLGAYSAYNLYKDIKGRN